MLIHKTDVDDVCCFTRCIQGNIVVTCKTTHIVYICFMYERATILPRVQRVKQHTSCISVICMGIQLHSIVYNVQNKHTSSTSVIYNEVI
jgi:hypothetical protein